MKLIKEHIGFKRGKDTKEAIGIGKGRVPYLIEFDKLAKQYGFQEFEIPEELIESHPHLNFVAFYKNKRGKTIEVYTIPQARIDFPYAQVYYNHKERNIRTWTPDYWEKVVKYGEEMPLRGFENLLPAKGLEESMEFKRDKNSKKGLNLGENRIIKAPFDWDNIAEGNYVATFYAKDFFEKSLIKIIKKEGEAWVQRISYWTSGDVFKKNVMTKDLIEDTALEKAEDWENRTKLSEIQKTDNHPELFESLNFERTGNSKKGLKVGEFRTYEAPFDWDNIPDGNYVAKDPKEPYAQNCYIRVKKMAGIPTIKQISYWISSKLDPGNHLIPNPIIRPAADWTIENGDFLLEKIEEKIQEKFSFQRTGSTKKGMNIGIRERNRKWEIMMDSLRKDLNIYRVRSWGNSKIYATKTTGEWEQRDLENILQWFKTSTPYVVKSIKKTHPVKNIAGGFRWTIIIQIMPPRMDNDDYPNFKTKIIKESNNFERDNNSKKSLNIGANRIIYAPIDWNTIPDGDWEFISKDNKYSYIKIKRSNQIIWLKKLSVKKEEGIKKTFMDKIWNSLDDFFDITESGTWVPLHAFKYEHVLKGIRPMNQKLSYMYESLNFERRKNSKDSMGVGIKEVNRDLETLSTNFQDHFDKYTFLEFQAVRREPKHKHYYNSYMSKTDRFPIYLYFIIDSMESSEFELDRKRKRFKAWFRKNTPYILQSEQKGVSFFNEKSPSGYGKSYTFFLDDK